MNIPRSLLFFVLNILDLADSLIYNNIKVNKSVYIAKSRQWFDVTLSNLFVARAKLHRKRSEHAYSNHGTTCNMNMNSSIELLIDLVDSVTAIPSKLPRKSCTFL